MAGGSNPESNKNVRVCNLANPCHTIFKQHGSLVTTYCKAPHRQFLGNNLSGLGLSHLLILEKQVEESLRNVRLKKEQMMNDQIQEMNKKRCITNNENMELHQKINIISEENIKLKKETGHTSSEILNSTNTPEVPDAASLELRQPLSKELEELDEPTMEQHKNCRQYGDFGYNYRWRFSGQYVAVYDRNNTYM